jgi:hypothetical protein
MIASAVLEQSSQSELANFDAGNKLMQQRLAVRTSGTPQMPSALTLEERMAQAASNNQKELLLKRVKSDGAGQEMSTYQKQVSDYEASLGINIEEGSKWLVR